MTPLSAARSLPTSAQTFAAKNVLGRGPDRTDHGKIRSGILWRLAP